MNGIYLLVIYGDIEPELLGPFKDEDERDAKALKIRKEEGDRHGIFMLTVEETTHKPEVNAYSGGFFEDAETGKETSDESG
jgi:hypothetical protein